MDTSQVNGDATPASISTSVGADALTGVAPPSAPEFKVPEQYASETWAQGIDSPDKLFDQFANAQKLIGKKTIGVPTAESSPEEWDEFYSKIRPESPEAYEFERNLPEDMKEVGKVDESTLKMFHELGLTQQQVKGLMNYYDQSMTQEFNDLKTQQENVNAEFDKLATEAFGKDVDTKIKKSAELLGKYAPESMKEHLKNIDNNTAILLAGVINNIYENHISEDAVVGGGDPVPVASVDELRNKAKTIMASPDWKNDWKNDSLKAQVNEIYAQIARMTNK